MPTPQAIFAASKMNWRRAAPLLGDLLFVVAIKTSGCSRRVGLSPHPVTALPDCPFPMGTQHWQSTPLAFAND